MEDRIAELNPGFRRDDESFADWLARTRAELKRNARRIADGDDPFLRGGE